MVWPLKIAIGSLDLRSHTFTLVSNEPEINKVGYSSSGKIFKQFTTTVWPLKVLETLLNKKTFM